MWTILFVFSHVFLGTLEFLTLSNLIDYKFECERFMYNGLIVFMMIHLAVLSGCYLLEVAESLVLILKCHALTIFTSIAVCVMVSLFEKNECIENDLWFTYKLENLLSIAVWLCVLGK